MTDSFFWEVGACILDTLEQRRGQGPRVTPRATLWRHHQGTLVQAAPV